MKGVWRARIATRLNDVSPVNFLIAFHRGCQHNPLEESAVSKGVGLARSPWTFWKRGVSREWKVVDVHGEGRPRVCVNLSSVDVHVDFIRRRGIVGGGGTCYADLKIGRKEHSEEEGLERMCRNWKRGGWNDGNGKNYFSGMKYNFFFLFFFQFWAMKLSVSLSWRDEMNFYRARSMLSDNSLGCFVNLYFYSKRRYCFW